MARGWVLAAVLLACIAMTHGKATEQAGAANMEFLSPMFSEALQDHEIEAMHSREAVEQDMQWAYSAMQEPSFLSAMESMKKATSTFAVGHATSVDISGTFPIPWAPRVTATVSGSVIVVKKKNGERVSLNALTVRIALQFFAASVGFSVKGSIMLSGKASVAALLQSFVEFLLLREAPKLENTVKKKLGAAFNHLAHAGGSDNAKRASSRLTEFDNLGREIVSHTSGLVNTKQYKRLLTYFMRKHQLQDEYKGQPSFLARVYKHAISAFSPMKDKAQRALKHAGLATSRRGALQFSSQGAVEIQKALQDISSSMDHSTRAVAELFVGDVVDMYADFVYLLQRRLKNSKSVSAKTIKAEYQQLVSTVRSVSFRATSFGKLFENTNQRMLNSLRVEFSNMKKRVAQFAATAKKVAVAYEVYYELKLDAKDERDTGGASVGAAWLQGIKGSYSLRNFNSKPSSVWSAANIQLSGFKVGSLKLDVRPMVKWDKSMIELSLFLKAQRPTSTKDAADSAKAQEFGKALAQGGAAISQAVVAALRPAGNTGAKALRALATTKPGKNALGLLRQFGGQLRSIVESKLAPVAQSKAVTALKKTTVSLGAEVGAQIMLKFTFKRPIGKGKLFKGFKAALSASGYAATTFSVDMGKVFPKPISAKGTWKTGRSFLIDASAERSKPTRRTTTRRTAANTLPSHCGRCVACIKSGGGNGCKSRCPSSCGGNKCVDCVIKHQGGTSCKKRCTVVRVATNNGRTTVSTSNTNALAP